MLWCLGRLGARVPLYGPANTVVLPRGGRTRWVEAVLSRASASEREIADAIFALAQMARVSGDRARGSGRRPCGSASLARLAELGADEAAMGPVREYHELEASQEGVALGDALPVGLRLVTEESA